MGSKILLADDSITIQKVVNLTFTDEGIEVVSVSNGDMAERRLKEVDPDLVLADIFMPGKNGYELCEAIKQNPQFRDVPVVLLVGAFEPFNESEARRVKADAHLTKPFESRVLVETVKNLIEKSPRQRSAPVASEPLTQQAAAEPAPFQSARPMDMPAIDLSAMSNPFPPQESVFADRVSASSLADQTPFADSFPNNFDFSQNQPQAPPATLEFSVDTSPSSPDAEPSASAPASQEFSTFEPTQPLYTDLFNVEGSFQAPQNSATADLAADNADIFDSASNFDSSESMPLGNFDVVDRFANQAEVPTVFESHYEAQAFADVETQAVDGGNSQAADVFADFEKLDVIEEQGVQALSSFEVDKLEPASSQATDYQGHEVDAQAARRFDTNELESPEERSFSPTLNHSDNALNGNGSSDASQQNKDFATDQDSSERDPSLLSADDPLGDVFNDFLNPDFGVQAEAAPLEFEEPVVPAQASQTPEAESQIVSEPVTEPVAAEVDPLTAFEVSEAAVVEEVTSPVVVSEMPTQDFSFVAPDNQESSTSFESVAPSSANHFEVRMPQKAEPIEVDANLTSSTQFNFYTEPEKEETPEADASASASEAVVAEEAVADEAQAKEDKFIASDMWEAQTQFTPVSIEALPTAELATAQTQETAKDQTEAVTSTAMPLDSSSPSQSAPAEVAQQREDHHLEKAIPQGVGMNKEMMDEIVRQVVSQLSDSVIREIAWEVVPDCVERVVTNLTKQDLSRRM